MDLNVPELVSLSLPLLELYVSCWPPPTGIDFLPSLVVRLCWDLWLLNLLWLVLGDVGIPLHPRQLEGFIAVLVGLLGLVLKDGLLRPIRLRMLHHDL